MRAMRAGLLIAIGCGACLAGSAWGDRDTAPTPQAKSRASPRWVHRYVPPAMAHYRPEEDRWRPESEVSRGPVTDRGMVVWEVSEYPPGSIPTPAEKAAADDMVERCFAAALRHGWHQYERGLADGYRSVDDLHYRNDEYMRRRPRHRSGSPGSALVHVDPARWRASARWRHVLRQEPGGPRAAVRRTADRLALSHMAPPSVRRPGPLRGLVGGREVQEGRTVAIQWRDDARLARRPSSGPLWESDVHSLPGTHCGSPEEARGTGLLRGLSVLFFRLPGYCWFFSSRISPHQLLMVRQPRLENQSVSRRRHHAGSLLDASSPPHLGASSLHSRLLPEPKGTSPCRTGTASAAGDLRVNAPETQTDAPRSRVLGGAISVLAALERHARDRQAGHSDSLAPQGFPPLLASHFEAGSWSTADP